MTTTGALKEFAAAAIDAKRDWLIGIAKSALQTPETGFREAKTSRLVHESLTEIGIPHENGIALTGIKGYLKGGSSGPTVALIGELDSLKVQGHPHADPDTAAAHACGHHAQLGMMLGAAVGLMVPEVLAELSGRIALMAVPAEEFIELQYRWGLRQEGKLGLLSGKQEFIRLGAFDDVDMAMMTHTSASPAESKFSVGGTSNGHLAKHVRFIGRAAHAGSSPHRGVNALQAAMVALNAINTQRETFRDADAVRLHGILTSGGSAANSIPAEVEYEGRVRGISAEAITDAASKMDRCLRAGALALGSKVEILTVPGYLPMVNNEPMTKGFKANCERLMGHGACKVYPDSRTRGGSTDLGDVSHIVPAIHPYTGGATGSGHGTDYLVNDYEQAVINPAKAIAMTAIDLLANRAAMAKEVTAKSKPRMTKKQYLKLQTKRFSEEVYDPAPRASRSGLA